MGLPTLLFYGTEIRGAMVEQEISRIARQVADNQIVEIIAINLSGGRKRKLLKITIDKDGGVTLGDCERFSRGFESLLEGGDLIAGSYTIEVSSPGLDMPLITMTDFERNIGRLVRVITKDKIYNQNFFIGRIVKVAGDAIQLFVNNEEKDIPFENIARARLEIEIR